MDENISEEKTTRSGKKRNSAGSAIKRKRKATSEENTDTTPRIRARMTEEQEQAAPPASGTVAFTWKQFTDHLAKELNRSKNETLQGINKRLDATEADLEKHKKEVREELNKMKSDIAAINVGAAAAPGGPTPYRDAAAAEPAAMVAQSHDLRQYWFSRRCLRMSPIDGDGEDQVWENARKFMQEMMRIPSTELAAGDIVDIRKIRTAKGRQQRAEVNVVFVDVATRDRVSSYSKNLASFVSSDGKPMASVRPDVPGHLGGVHRALL